MNPAELPLRDIHLPPPPGWWPPAPGWWLLLGAVLLLIAALFWWRRRRRSESALSAARRELACLRAAVPTGDAHRLAQDLSVLMRRVALSFYPRAEVAALTGSAWLAFLDRGLADRPFEDGPGRLLAELPYRPQVSAAEVAPLFDLCARWIETAAATAESRP